MNEVGYPGLPGAAEKVADVGVLNPPGEPGMM